MFPRIIRHLPHRHPSQPVFYSNAELSIADISWRRFNTLCALHRRSHHHPQLQGSSTTSMLQTAGSSVSNGTMLLTGNVTLAFHHRQSWCLFSTVAQQRIPIPPNLHIDPRSSFVIQQSSYDEDEDGEDPNDDDVEELGSVADQHVDAVLQTDITYVDPLPDRLHVTVTALDGSEAGTLWLDARVFGRDPIRIDLLKRAVDYHRAKLRGKRKAVTKTISEVSGSGRKLRQQKGTGRARVGHGRPPHFRGGAKAHGPKNVTDYGNTKLNKKVRKQALCHALSQKLKEGNVIVVNSLEVPTHKTKELDAILQQWDIGGILGDSALILDHYYPDQNEENSPSYRGVPANLYVASRNIPKIRCGNTHAANVYELLKNVKLVLTVEALTVLEGRLKNF